MTSIGSIKAGAIPIYAGALSIFTIGTCYYLATTAGHTKPLPYTDITHCALYAPERFVFRVGMIPASCALALVWFLAGSWVRNLERQAQGRPPKNSGPKSLFAILGYISSAMLVVSSSVLESDGTTMWPLHVACASGFFLLTVIAQTLLTLKLWKVRQLVNESSLNRKITCNCFCWIGLLLSIISSIAPVPGYFTKVIEWVLTAIVILYHFSFAQDWKDPALSLGAVIASELDLPQLYQPLSTVVENTAPARPQRQSNSVQNKRASIPAYAAPAHHQTTNPTQATPSASQATLAGHPQYIYSAPVQATAVAVRNSYPYPVL